MTTLKEVKELMKTFQTQAERNLNRKKYVFTCPVWHPSMERREFDDVKVGRKWLRIGTLEDYIKKYEKKPPVQVNYFVGSEPPDIDIRKALDQFVEAMCENGEEQERLRIAEELNEHE